VIREMDLVETDECCVGRMSEDVFQRLEIEIGITQPPKSVVLQVRAKAQVRNSLSP